MPSLCTFRSSWDLVADAMGSGPVSAPGPAKALAAAIGFDVTLNESGIRLSISAINFALFSLSIFSRRAANGLKLLPGRRSPVWVEVMRLEEVEGRSERVCEEAAEVEDRKGVCEVDEDGCEWLVYGLDVLVAG